MVLLHKHSEKEYLHLSTNYPVSRNHEITARSLNDESSLPAGGPVFLILLFRRRTNHLCPLKEDGARPFDDGSQDSSPLILMAKTLFAIDP
jgi:hypothetical protein